LALNCSKVQKLKKGCAFLYILFFITFGPVSVIEEIYKDEKYFRACQKIAGQEADDLFQHINLKILELERAGKFNCKKNLFSYFYTMAKREFFGKRDKYRRTHHERHETTSFEVYHDTPDDTTQSPNDQHFQDLDDFARSPAATESEQMIKGVYLEITKPDFAGIKDLSKRTKINKFTLYGALHRFRELYNDSIDSDNCNGNDNDLV